MDKKFIVCTDSGCDLSIDILNENGIIPFFMEYEIDGEVVKDTMKEEDFHKFYDKMRAGSVPKTSQTNIYQFKDFWKPLIEKYDLPIVHISLGSGVSGTFNNGVEAAKQLEAEIPGSKIYVVDSTLCSVGYGMLALHSAQMRDNGDSPEDCVKWIEENKARINTWYTTDELKYLYKSGRLSKVGEIVGSMLNICPILNLDLEGHLINQEKVRGLNKTIKRIYEIMDGIIENPKDQVAWVCHSDIPEKAKEFGDGMQARYGFKEIKYTYIGPIIGANCGPGLMAIFFWGKERTMAGYKG